jgi:tRNA (adenine37-N6)-methyltransferase
MTYSFSAIGFIQSCFKEKFAVPRQPGLAPHATATLTLVPPFNQPDAVEGLQAASHIWIQFVFHECIERGWQAKVRPPRLGGNKKVGVFATRSTHRPNPIGLSVVKLERIETGPEKVVLHLSGIDLIDGTPVLDIKPYIPYSDSLPHAQHSFAGEEPNAVAVNFSPAALAQLADWPDQNYRDLIVEVLSQDPKPAYQKPDPQRIYGVLLGAGNVQWRYLDNAIVVESIDYPDAPYHDV